MTERDHRNKHAQEACQTEDDQRHRIFRDDRQVDRGDAEEYQIIRAGTGDLVVDSGIHVAVDRRLAQKQEKGDGKKISDRKVGNTGEHIRCQHHAVQIVADTCNAEDDAQVEAERVQRHGADRLIADGTAGRLGNQAGLQVAADILEVLDVTGIALFRRPLDKDQAAENAGQNANRRKRHAKVCRFAPAESSKGLANSCRRSVAAAEAGCHQDADPLIQLRIERVDHGERQRDRNEELKEEHHKPVKLIADDAVRLSFSVRLFD